MSNPDMKRLCEAAEAADIGWEPELNSADFRAIVRAVLAEIEALAVEQEERGQSIHAQQMGRYAGMFTRRLLSAAEEVKP